MRQKKIKRNACQIFYHYIEHQEKHKVKKEFTQLLPHNVMAGHRPTHRSGSLLILLDQLVLRRLLEGLCLLAITLLLLLHLDTQHLVLLNTPLDVLSSTKNATKDAQTFSEKVERRQTRVAEVCKRHKPRLVWDERRMEKSMRRHLWDVVNHLVYCPIAKVASTTWFSNFLAWSHIKRANVPHVLKQFEEVGSRNGKGKENWEGEAGGKGIRTLARYQMTWKTNEPHEALNLASQVHLPGSRSF